MKKKHSSIASETRSNPISDRFFVAGRHRAGDTLEISGGDARKIVTVLRRQTGDTIEIIDSAAQRFRATLRIENRRVHAQLGELADPMPVATRWNVTVAQGIPKGQKMDFAIEKLTELGVNEVIPFYSERTVVGDLGESKLERWRRLAKTAAQQCGRGCIPQVRKPQMLADIIESFASYDIVLFPWELARNEPLRDRLPQLVGDARSILVLIGPEGGFSSEEAARAVAAGAQMFSLGTRILRTETVGLVILALLNYRA